MTKGHIKKGKTDSKTPFDLLRDYAEGDENAGKLFRIYFEAFKGTRQLNWSKGLKTFQQGTRRKNRSRIS